MRVNILPSTFKYMRLITDTFKRKSNCTS